MSKHLLAGFTALLLLFVLAGPAQAQVCGDVDGNGYTNISDLVTFVEYLCAPSIPANWNAANADMDPFPGANISDMTYLVFYLFHAGPVPCNGGPVVDDMTPGGQVSLEYVAGTMGPSMVGTGYPLSFRVRITNNTDRYVMGISNGFTVYSPDGASIGAVELSSGSLWQELWYIETWTWEPAASEAFGNVAFGLFPPGVAPDYTGSSYQINLEPLAAEDAGKTICFDSSYFGAGGTWMWAIDGNNTLKPSWDGPHCYTIEEALYFPGDIDLDGDITIADLIDMVTYMFQDGEPPAILDACDVNGSCFDPDIADVTYLVDYMFGDGEMPVFSCAGPAAKTAVDAESLILETSYEAGYTIVRADSRLDLAGIQLTMALAGEPDQVLNLADDNLEVFHGYADGRLTLGMFDMEGEVSMAAGNRELVRIKGEGHLLSATAADVNNTAIAASIVHRKDHSLPTDFALIQNYPNPFNGYTAISFSLAKQSDVVLEIFDITGRSVTVLVDASMAAGDHAVSWDGTAADGTATASGVYFYKLTANGQTDSRKMMYLK